VAVMILSWDSMHAYARVEKYFNTS